MNNITYNQSETINFAAQFLTKVFIDMKKLLFCLVLALSMSSCYNSRVCVGDVKKDDPTVKVNSVTNHHFLYGLIPGGKTKIEASKYIGKRKNYVVKNNWTFLNGFLGCLTMGIYTPTTTTFYVPIDEVSKE